MRTAPTHAKLFMLSGALCSGAAFAIAFASALPNVHGAQMTAAAVGSAPATNTAALPPNQISLKDFAALSVLFDGRSNVIDAPVSDEREISVNLDAKTLIVTEGTTTVASFSILSIGRPGTFWETPAGDYAVKTKETKHLSSIGNTWMPWSMQFYGNFFIHGWPTYQDGTDVPKGYSGGCIRLSTPDAEKLFGLVRVNTRMHVTGGTLPLPSNEMRYYMRDTGALPEVSAQAFSVFDEETGQVLWSHGEDALVHPGRLVALMTALVSVETIDQYKYIDFEKLVKGKDVASARATDVGAVQVGALLYPLLFDGSDIAAKGIVKLRGEKVFRNYMNEKSKAIGMMSTEWSGGTSLTVSTTTPRDLAKLLSYSDTQKSFLMKATLTEEHSFEPFGQARFSWKNKNAWLLDSRFQGGLLVKEKDGTSNSLSLYDLPVSEFGTRKIGFVVIGSRHAEDDLAAIREYAGTHFFYGSQNGVEAVYAATSDLAAKVEEMKLIKEQLLN
ncbi:MAG TPA: L,D-transpeptidase family protein [Candidatus Paceibacterota bacterium]|nr:L,D-transpeptidase family protein [Candidatus Paceibacterota bacterium]